MPGSSRSVVECGGPLPLMYDAVQIGASPASRRTIIFPLTVYIVSILPKYLNGCTETFTPFAMCAAKLSIKPEY